MSTTTLKFDTVTLEAQLARAIQDRSSLEQMLGQKQEELNKAVKSFSDTVEQYKGALQYNALIIEKLKKDIEDAKSNGSAGDSSKS